MHAATLTLVTMLAAAGAARAADFHTDPSCWKAPRLYAAGAPSPEIAANVRLESVVGVGAPAEVTRSPNGAYAFWVDDPDTTRPGPWHTTLWVDTELGRGLRLDVENVLQPLTARWINENLIYLRVVFGRIAFLDLIVDVEAGTFVHRQEVRDGTIAFQQFRESCARVGGCRCAPPPGDADRPASKPGAESVIGLLELPSVLNHDVHPSVAPPPDVPRRPVAVHVEVDGEKRQVARLGEPSDFQTAEHAYELAAAVVYEREPGWYRVGLGPTADDTGATAWVRAEDAGSFHDVGDLLTSHAAYLDGDWDGRLWDAPSGPGSPRRSARKGEGARPEQPAEIVEAREVDGGLWLHVRLYATDPCEGGDRTIAEEGWVPAYAPSGALTAWFWSRGC